MPGVVTFAQRPWLRPWQQSSSRRDSSPDATENFPIIRLIQAIYECSNTKNLGSVKVWRLEYRLRCHPCHFDALPRGPLSIAFQLSYSSAIIQTYLCNYTKATVNGNHK
ncbi:hypothetical protein TNCV_2440711 [Trichonephila clavipes]|nr:hypothetical protein TNCV_2440711 [Trichonephila clavipes]